ncbi:MAG: phage portal protein [Rhizobiaceae bacterium]|nr:phage portal protein [Rhizobiaceae bacterium]
MTFRRNIADNSSLDSALSQKSYAKNGYISLHETGLANWSSRNYLSMSREGFMRNPIAHRAIRMISETAANVPWTLFEGEVELNDHPALKLIQTPNNMSGAADFLEGLYGHLLLSGDAFVKVITDGEKPLELHALRPDRMRVVSGRDGWPEAFEYQVGNHKERFEISTEITPQILHLKLFHPLDDHMGFAPLEAALMALDLHNSASGWNKALLDNSARPSGALVYQPKDGGNLTQDQFDRLKGELEEGYSGVQKAGKPLLLEGGLDWKAIGLTPKDMDFVEAKNGASRDIALALGVPPMLLGIPGDNTYANYQEANRAFSRLTVLPLVTRIAARMSAYLQKYYSGDFRFTPDIDKMPGLSSERDMLWSRIENTSFLTNQEKRKAVGYQSVADKD